MYNLHVKKHLLNEKIIKRMAKSCEILRGTFSLSKEKKKKRRNKLQKDKNKRKERKKQEKKR